MHSWAYSNINNIPIAGQYTDITIINAIMSINVNGSVNNNVIDQSSLKEESVC